MFMALPLVKSGKFLGDSSKEPDNDADWCRFHVVAEFFHHFLVLDPVSRDLVNYLEERT